MHYQNGIVCSLLFAESPYQPRMLFYRAVLAKGIQFFILGREIIISRNNEWR